VTRGARLWRCAKTWLRYRHPRRGRGGTGRRAGFKIQFREECGFDSHRPHHLIFAGSDKPTARGLEPASVERSGLDGPRSAARNDNRTALSCWRLADHPGCNHRQQALPYEVLSNPGVVIAPCGGQPSPTLQASVVMANALRSCRSFSCHNRSVVTPKRRRNAGKNDRPIAKRSPEQR
jgi:hypothetical protein